MAESLRLSGIGREISSDTRHQKPYAISKKAFNEEEHQLEKLEFALAIAETEGDLIRSASLRAQIANLGGNVEEPGT